MGLATRTSTPQGWPGPGRCWASRLSAAEINTEFPIWCHSLGWSSSYLHAGCWHRTTSLWKGQSGRDTYSGYGFAFSVNNTCTKTNIHGFSEWLIHHSPPQSIASQVAHITAKGWQWAFLNRIHWCYLILYHSDAAGLLKLWNDLLRTQNQ